MAERDQTINRVDDAGTEGTATAPKRSFRRIVGRIALLVAVGLAGYAIMRTQVPAALSPAIPASSGAAAGYNVVLITLDTLRADYLSCYGYPDTLTPHLDALSAGGVRFSDTTTCVPMTLPAHSSIMTGQYPPTHGVRDNGTFRLIADRVTLAEQLQAKGYTTAALIAAFVLDARYGLDQGFDFYDDEVSLAHRTGDVQYADPQRPGNEVIDAAMTWLDTQRASAADTPFFMWIHLFDPHSPYAPPEPYRSRYKDPYAGEVAFTDAQVGRFVQKLRETELLDRTVLIVVGDHGEGLGEHGESAHSLLIYESTMHVPLIWHAPGVLPAGRVVDDRVVSVVDIAPTLLDLLGLEPGENDGSSLLRGGADRDRVVYMETLAPALNRGWSPLHALRRHRDKYIEAPTPEYYDLTMDRFEVTNLWDDRTEEADTLETRLEEMMAAFAAAGAKHDTSVTPDAEALSKLAALGYVGGGGGRQNGTLPDPKDVIVAWERTVAVEGLISQGRAGEALPIVESLLAAEPADAEIWLLLSRVQERIQQKPQAIASMQKAVELRPDDAGMRLRLANLQYEAGDRAAAQVSLAEAGRIEPEHGGVILAGAHQDLEAGRYDDALAGCAAVRQVDADRYGAAAWALEGKVHEAAGATARADDAFQRAYEADPRNTAALWGLARAALREERYERAIEFGERLPRSAAEWPASRALLAQAYLKTGGGEAAVAAMRQLTAYAPTNPAAHNNLGNVLNQLQRYDEAIACYREAIRLNPDYPLGHFNLAMALRDHGDTLLALEHLRKMVELDPASADGWAELVQLLRSVDRQDEALEACEKLRAAAPQDPRAYRLTAELAWNLATAPQADQRDGAEAVRLGELALEMVKEKNAAARLDGAKIEANVHIAAVFDALAAAYAEVGRFDAAVEGAELAKTLAEHAGQLDLAAKIAERIALYGEGKPYHTNSSSKESKP